MPANSTTESRILFRPPSVSQVDVGGFWGGRIDAVADRTADILYERCEIGRAHV